MKVEITNTKTGEQVGIYPIAIEMDEIFELMKTNGGLFDKVLRLVADAGLVNIEEQEDHGFTIRGDAEYAMYMVFPVHRKIRDDVFDAHKHSSDNEREIKSSELCGCFGCLKIMKPTEVDFFEFRDKNNKNPRTACCPDCIIDTVIGSSSGYPITREFLKEMNNYWCGGRAE
jgi:hypothetical protein